MKVPVSRFYENARGPRNGGVEASLEERPGGDSFESPDEAVGECEIGSALKGLSNVKAQSPPARTNPTFDKLSRRV